jgi:hypothetical protein
MNRRLFLRGLGGACVAAPFLGSLVGRGAKAEATRPPQRLIVMFTHYGCITTRWFPKKSHGALTAEDLVPTTLRPLTPFVDKLLMPRGIRAMNEWTADMSRGQGNDPFLNVAGSYFTCQPVSPNSNDPFSFDNLTKFNAKPLGPSLDHVIAQQLSPEGKPLYVRVGNQNDAPPSQLSYSAAQMPYPGVGTAAAAFATLTGLFPGATPDADSYAAVRGKSVLDLVSDDLDTLERFDMSQADRNKLEAWKDLLHETGGTVMTNPACTPAAADALGLSQGLVDAASEWPPTGDLLTTKITASLDVADVYSNIAALAALCYANPVIFLKYPSSYVYKGLGISIDTTSLNQRTGNASMTGLCVEGIVDQLVTLDDYLARKFAHLVEVLDGIQEGDGTLLDNSATVWFHQMSDGCAHNLNNLPILQAGGAGGYFKTGCAVNVEDGSADLTAGNSEVFCTEGGSEEVDGLNQASGTDPKLANAPINKYFCNLMNAVGVKAGDDGFPLAGGTEPVRCFGMYDRTEDFIGGGTVPPTIHSPGEYEALRG